jgi:hypothetical protein
MDVQEWAEDLVTEVYEKWETYRDKYNFSESGFRVFFTPVVPTPDLMIIGHNPDSDDKPFNKEEDSRLPEFHEYLYHDSKIARKMIYLFEGVDRYDWLENSVKLNLFFFKSENAGQWSTMDQDLRSDLEMFCFRQVNDIIDTLKPRYIITEGLNVFDTLTHSILTGCEKPEVKFGYTGRKIYARSSYGNTKIIGLVHLAKERISYPEWNSVKDYLKTDLKDIEEMYLH